MSDAPTSEFDLATVDRLLSTTRAVRKRLDLERAVSREVILECLRLAVQAPTGTNSESWRWVVVTDPGIRSQLADLYRHPDAHGEIVSKAPAVPDSPAQRRVQESAAYLTDRMDEVPVLVVPCVQDAGGAAGWPPSIYPAVWSFILALRSRGLGTVLTTRHLFRKDEAAAILGIPDGFVQACMLPVAYYTGESFKPAGRRPIEEVTFFDRWGQQ